VRGGEEFFEKAIRESESTSTPPFASKVHQSLSLGVEQTLNMTSSERMLSSLDSDAPMLMPE
jgi:hypothetical protein